MAGRILIASGDESQWAQSLAGELGAFGYQVDLDRHERAAQHVAKGKLDAFLWDLNPPADAAFRGLAALRGLGYYPPVVALSPDCDQTKAVVALKYGCDCMLASPASAAFPPTWILYLDGIIEAVMRRRRLEHSMAARREFGIRVGDLEIDSRRCVVRIGNRIAELTNRELNLLLQLAETPGVARSKRALLESVWGSSHEGLLTSLTTHINRLRMKIEPDLKNPRYIVGIWGVGYKLVASDEESIQNISPATLAEPTK